MENKTKKKSINTVIYLLLAAMLVCVVFVSVYTVASKRSKPAPATPDTAGTADTAKPSETAAPADTHGNPPETSADTTAKTAPSAATEPAVEVDADTLPTAVTDGESIPTSPELRYFVLPVNGTVAKDYEIDIPVYSMTMNDYRAHTGIDISAPVGSEVVAASSGIVCRVWSDPMMGRCLTVDHGDSIYTTYMNLADELPDSIAVGAKITMGQAVGAVGETSLVEIAEEPHLHLEMTVSGSYVDPLEYISADDSTVTYE